MRIQYFLLFHTWINSLIAVVSIPLYIYSNLEININDTLEKLKNEGLKSSAKAKNMFIVHHFYE